MHITRRNSRQCQSVRTGRPSASAWSPSSRRSRLQRSPGGAGAKPTDRARCRGTPRCTPRAPRGDRSAASTRSGRVTPPAYSGCCTRPCSATTRSRTGSSRGSPRAASGRAGASSSPCAAASTWNDGKPLTAADVKFTFETGQAGGLAVLHDVEDGAAERHHQRQRRSSSTSRAPELPGLGHQHVLDPDRPEAHLVGLQRQRDHDGQHRRPRASAPGRSRTAPARAPHRRCSGTGAPAGGRPRRSA